MSRSREGLTLVNDVTKPKFTNEFRSWIQAWMQQQGVLTLNQTELAERMGIDKQLLSRWLHGTGRPNPDSCRMLARFFGLNEDYVLMAAGRPTFNDLISAVEQHRFDWQDGQQIYNALKATQERMWRFSPSMWKVRAERDFQQGWSSDFSERELHAFAFDIAQIIFAWKIDQMRDVPFSQRALSA